MKPLEMVKYTPAIVTGKKYLNCHSLGPGAQMYFFLYKKLIIENSPSSRVGRSMTFWEVVEYTPRMVRGEFFRLSITNWGPATQEYFFHLM